MRVLIDRRLAVRGVKRYSRELTDALDTIPGLELSVVDPGGMSRAPFTPWGRRYVAERASSWGADVIHGLHFEIPRSRIRSVVTIQDLIPLEFPGSMPSRIRRRLFARIVRRSTEFAIKVIVPSKLTAESLTRFGVKAEKVKVIPLWASPVFRPIDADEVLKARQRFAGGKPYVASLFHSKAHKNFVAFLQAAEHLRGKTDAAFVAAGLPEGVGDAVRRARTTSDEDLRQFMSGAEVFVLPSLLEGFGLPVVESLACGTPVVCGERVGALAWCERGAVVCDVGKSQELASVIHSLVSDPSTLHARAQEGRAQVEALSVTRAAAATSSVYEEAVS